LNIIFPFVNQSQCSFFIIFLQEDAINVFYNVCLCEHPADNSNNQEWVKYAHKLCKNFSNHGMLNSDCSFHLMIFKNQQSKPTKTQSFLNINPRKDCVNSLKIIDFISLCWWLYQQSFNNCRWCFNKTKPRNDYIIWI